MKKGNLSIEVIGKVGKIEKTKFLLCQDWLVTFVTFFAKRSTGHSKHRLLTTQEKTTYGRHRLVNTEIRLFILSIAKDGDVLYS